MSLPLTATCSEPFFSSRVSISGSESANIAPLCEQAQLTLPAQLEVDNVRDLDIDHTEESLVGLKRDLANSLTTDITQMLLTFLLNFLWSKIWTATTEESLTVLRRG